MVNISKPLLTILLLVIVNSPVQGSESSSSESSTSSKPSSSEANTSQTNTSKINRQKSKANATDDPHHDDDHEPDQEHTVSTIDIDQQNDAPFWQQASLIVSPRLYYLNRGRDSSRDSEALAFGGSVAFRSGWVADHLQIGVTGYTSQKVYAPSGKDGTDLLQPGQESYSVIGELQATIRFYENIGMRIGRQRFELPYLGSSDSRMVPRIYQAIAVGDTSTAVDGLAWIAGYVEKVKYKTEDKFIDISEAIGIEESETGLSMLGVKYDKFRDWEISVIDLFNKDAFNTFFIKAEKKYQLGPNFDISTDFQFTQQNDVGKSYIGDFDTHLFAAKVQLHHNNTRYRAAFSTTADEQGIQKPYGSSTNYLSVIIEDFDRAGENAFLLGVSHNFGQIGPGRLSTFANIVKGNTPDSGPQASPDQTEYNLTFDYRLNTGKWDRLSFRTRLAYLNQEDGLGGNDLFDFRFIVNYSFELLD
ncbi:OprD family outer membrane porin [Kangiella sp. TOML190]|uniref:OprD family outer membrane porin n=1 Tax=Kangiella sp. TOML190 TaxID=2931351 RepID=UPI00203CC9F3|nr:OprD family outer membrane porin [Kangiella sp. TOML190]